MASSDSQPSTRSIISVDNNRQSGGVDWGWVLNNMRYCSKCGCFKILDQFEKQRDKCKQCTVVFKRKITKKPVPAQIKDEIEIHQNINKGLTGSEKIKLTLQHKRGTNVSP